MRCNFTASNFKEIKKKGIPEFLVKRVVQEYIVHNTFLLEQNCFAEENN